MFQLSCVVVGVFVSPGLLMKSANLWEYTAARPIQGFAYRGGKGLHGAVSRERGNCSYLEMEGRLEKDGERAASSRNQRRVGFY